MAKPQYSVGLTFGISCHIGEWAGNEQQMEPEHTYLFKTFNKEDAERVYAFMAFHKDWDWKHILGLSGAGEKDGSQ